MAALSYAEQVQQAYLAYYGRPADPAGQQYWVNQLTAANGDLNSIINAFGNSAESTALYGGSSPAAQVNAIYQTLFGRAADVTGLNYYVNGIVNGQFTLASVALNIYNGATGTDATELAAKLGYADSFTAALTQSAAGQVAYSGNAAASNARAAVAAVVDSTSQATATAALSTTIANIGTGTVAQTFALTTGVDSIVGAAAGSSVFNGTTGGTTATFNSFDSITGKGSSNVLNVSGDGAQPVGVSISGIQTANVVSTGTLSGAAAGAYDVTGWTGLTTFNGTAAGNVNVKGAATTALNITEAASTGTVTVAGGSADSVNVTSGAGNTVAVGITGIAGTASASVTGAGGAVTISDANYTATPNATSTANTIAAVTLNGDAGVQTINSNALTSLSISNENVTGGTASVVVNNATIGGHALAVALNGDGISKTGTINGLSITDANATSLAITSTGAASNVSLSAAKTTSATINAAVATTLAFASTGALTSVDASASTAAVSVDLTAATLNTTGAAFTGGAGNDTIKVTGAELTRGAFDTGVVTNGLANLSIDGGTGTNTVILSGVNSITGSTTAVTGDAGYTAGVNALKNVQILDFANTAATTIDQSKITNTAINTLKFDVSGAGAVTVNNATSAEHYSIGTAHGTGAINLSAGLGQSSLTVSLDGTALTNSTASAINVANAQSVNLSSNGALATGLFATDANVAGNVTLADNSSLNISGSQALKLSVIDAAPAAGESINASAFTGKLDITFDNSTVSFSAGSGGSTITTGSGVESLDLSASTGKADVLNLSGANSTAPNLISVKGFTTSALTTTDDVLHFGSATSTTEVAGIANVTTAAAFGTVANVSYTSTNGVLTLTGTGVATATEASLLSAAATIVETAGAGKGAVFAFGGNSYVVEATDATHATTVKLVGVTGITGFDVDGSHHVAGAIQATA